MPERSGRLELHIEREGWEGSTVRGNGNGTSPNQSKFMQLLSPLFSFLLLVFFNFSHCFSKKKQLRVEVENDQRVSGVKGEMGARNGATTPSRPVSCLGLRKYLFYLLRVIIKCAPRRLIGIDCVNKFIVDNKCLITPTPDTRQPTADGLARL